MLMVFFLLFLPLISLMLVIVGDTFLVSMYTVMFTSLLVNDTVLLSQHSISNLFHCRHQFLACFGLFGCIQSRLRWILVICICNSLYRCSKFVLATERRSDSLYSVFGKSHKFLEVHGFSTRLCQ